MLHQSSTSAKTDSLVGRRLLRAEGMSGSFGSDVESEKLITLGKTNPETVCVSRGTVY